jgi:ParB family chromosome partitioning protein
LQPILVRKTLEETFEIVAGERRFRASKLAGLKEIPCIIRELSDSQVFILAIIENVQRESLNPLEEAEGYLRLMTEFKHTQEEIAEVVGKSRSYIANLTRLTKLPNCVKELVIEGKLTSGHVRPLLSLKTEEQMLSVAEVVVENGYNVRKVEELVNLILSDEEKLETLEENLAKISKTISSKDEISSLISQIVLAFKEKFSTAIKIKPSKKGGMISIKYKNEEELKKIMQNMVHIPSSKEKNNVISIPGKEDFANFEIN